MGCAVGKTHSTLTWLLYCTSSWASNGAVRGLMIFTDLIFLNLCTNLLMFLVIEQYIFLTAYDFKKFNGYDPC